MKRSVGKVNKPKSKKSSSKKDSSDVYQYENDKIRNQNDRAGDISDDSDGELKGEDESIDDDGSEVGWDSDDEMAYGHLVKGKNGSSSSAQIQEDDSESDQEDAFEGEVLLSDMFTSNNSSSKVADKKKTPTQEEEEEGVSHNEDDDEDDDDDDDEEEEGEEDDDDDEDSENNNDEDDDEDGDNDAHNRLLKSINDFSKVEENATISKKRKLSNQSAEESMFSSVADDGAVSMDALLGALGEVKGLSVIKKQLIDLEKGTAVPAYVEKVVADRIERSIAYEGTSLEMAKWQETVTSNRHLKTLDLAQDKRLIPSYKDLVKKFKPTTDMEREVQMILVQTGATDEQAEQREVDELGSRNFSVEELKERQAELSKVKALMFYEQMKRHRLNKIKSKAYRRIRKKQKNKRESDEKDDLADGDPEQAREEEEREATLRVKERMDMKHKNTGKWARMALQHGRHDESLRLAYHESVQLGQELSKRINDDPKRRKQEGDDSDDDEEPEFESERGNKKQKTSERAAAEMMNVLEGAVNEPEATGKYKKLFQMDFMKKASDQQRERAKEEAQSMLREIEDMEGDSGSDNDEEKVAPVKDKAALLAAKEEMKKLLSQGMSLKGASKRLTVSGPISIKGLGGDERNKDDAVRWIAESDHEREEENRPATVIDNPWLLAPVVGKQRDSSGQQVSHKSAKKEGADKLYVNVSESVPQSSAAGQVTLVLDSKNTHAPLSKKQKQKMKQTNEQPSIQNGNVPFISDKNDKNNKNNKLNSNVIVENKSLNVTAAPVLSTSERKPLLLNKSQEDLVQIAFAGPDLEDDFQGFKDDAINDELGINEKRNKILSQVKAGWGDWAGPGASGISPKILGIRNRLLKKVEDETLEKKKGRSDTKKPNVMISDRRVKTAAKYKISEIPHPFTSREEYERSMQMPLGEEWNASNVVKKNTVPEILLRAGRIVAPIVIPKGNSKRKAPEEAAGGSSDTPKKNNRTIKSNKKHKK